MYNLKYKATERYAFRSLDGRLFITPKSTAKERAIIEKLPASAIRNLWLVRFGPGPVTRTQLYEAGSFFVGLLDILESWAWLQNNYACSYMDNTFQLKEELLGNR